MRKAYTLLICLLMLLQYGTASAQDPDPGTGRPLPSAAINGPTKVCNNTVTNYSFNGVNPPLGIAASFTWSHTNPIGNLSALTGPSTSILWTNTGVDTLKLVLKNSTGTIIGTLKKIITVQPVPQPIIITNQRVACQILDTGKGRENIFKDGQCHKVCEGSWVTYTALGLPGSTYTWTVTGAAAGAGSVITSGATCTIHWGPAGTGTVTVTETSTYGCPGTLSGCVDIITKPKAKMAVQQTGVVYDRVSVCLNQDVVFLNQSTATGSSPITNWYWDFGDNHTFSSTTSTNPVHQYTTDGSYTAMLVVKNACGCTDTARMRIEVQKYEGVTIVCPGVVCEKTRHTYSLAGDLRCSSYSWKVTGGTITSPSPYGSSIDVVWDHFDASGFGYISFDAAQCDVKCPGITTVKIPIIPQHGVIKGDAVICGNKQYLYRMPEWPGTVFNWTIDDGGHGAHLTHTDQPNEIVVNSGDASIVLTCTYTNTLLGCGGRAVKEIKVLPSETAEGPSTVCQNKSGYFFLSNGVSQGYWTLKRPDGTTTTTSTQVNDFQPVFTQPGNYIVTVSSPDFCSPDPIIVKCLPLPAKPNSLTGKDTACKGTAYEYTAESDVPGTIFTWSTSANCTIVGPASGPRVSVKFTGTGPYTITVARQGQEEPYCPGDTLNKTVINPVVNPVISGSNSVCPNSVTAYQSNYDEAISYEWSLTPATAGSIDNNRLQDINITWNNTEAQVNAVLKLRVSRCGYDSTFRYDSIIVRGAPVLALTSPDTVCSGAPFAVRLTGAPALTQGNVSWGHDALHPNTVIPNDSNRYVVENVTNSIMAYNLAVSISNYNGCPGSIVAQKTVYVRKKPKVTISADGLYGYCTGISMPLKATFDTTLVATLTWSTPAGLSSCSAPSFTCNPYVVTGTGNYFAMTTDVFGCRDTSKLLTVVIACPNPCSAPVPVLTGSELCGNIHIDASYTNTNLISKGFANTPGLINVVTNTSTNPATLDATARDTGTYRFYFSTVNTGNCLTTGSISIVVPMLANYSYGLNCNGGSGYTVSLNDASRRITGTTVTGYTYSIDGTQVYSGITSAFVSPVLGAGPHTIAMTITYVYNGQTRSCTATKTVVIPQLSNANFVFSPNNACVAQQSILFTDQSTGAPIQYLIWNFGDGTTNLLDSLKKTYVTAGTFMATLTTIDTFGCVTTDTQMVTTKANTLTGTMTATPAEFCQGSSAMLAYNQAPGTTPSTYQWHNDQLPFFTTSVGNLTVAETGNYWVQVSNSYGCFFNTTPVKPVIRKSMPLPRISGDHTYCEGSTFTLLGYAGADPGIQYTWYLDGGNAGSDPNLVQSGLDPGTYTYQLALQYGSCTAYSDPFVVTIMAKPAKPLITENIASCQPYSVDLTIDPVNPGTYNWSNGTTGSQTTVSVGGFYKVWYTDTNGCVVDTFVKATKDPQGYLWVFPTGCYDICPPVTIYGPIVPFSYWEWDYNHTMLHNGDGYVTPLNVLAGGSYNLQLDNGTCRVSSDAMNITVPERGCKEPGDCKMLRVKSMGIKDYGGCNYSLLFDISASYPVAVPYQVSVNAGTITPSGDILPAAGGTYAGQWTAPGGSYNGVLRFTIYFYLPDSTICVRTVEREVRCANEGPCGEFDMQITPFGQNGCNTSLAIQITNPATTGTLFVVPNAGSVTTTSTPLLIGTRTYINQWIAPAGFTSGIVDFTLTTVTNRGELVCRRTIPVAMNCEAENGGENTKAKINGPQASLTVAPNPAGSLALVTYNYGASSGMARSIGVYDMTGRRLAVHKVPDTGAGSWPLSLDEFTNGLYQIVMQEGSRKVAAIRLSVVH